MKRLKKAAAFACNYALVTAVIYGLMGIFKIGLSVNHISNVNCFESGGVDSFKITNQILRQGPLLECKKK